MYYTERDPVIGWEAIGRTSHPKRQKHLLAERLWQERDRMIEWAMEKDTPIDTELLCEIANIATALDYADDCGCVLPSQSCRACELAAHAAYILAELGV